MVTRGSAGDFSAKSVPKRRLRLPSLTDAAIRAAKPNSTLWDTSLKGFGVRAGKARKTFIVLIGDGRRQAIGPYPIISLSDARTEARRILAEKTLGKIRPRHVAFDDARADFLKECESRLRLLTVKLYRRHLTIHYPFGRTGVADVVPRQIIKQLNGLNHRPSEKEHAHRIGRTFFKWCVQQHLMDHSPMETMARPPLGPSRDRVLTDAELIAVYRTAATEATPFHRLVSLLLLLGLRRMETACLEWSFFNNDTYTLTVPGELTKNKRALVLPYGPTVAAILERNPKLSEKYIFPAAREQVRGKPATVMTGFGKAKQDFDMECGVKDWVLHDCRRVVATGLQKLGTRLEVIEAILNHVSGTRAGIVGVYQRYNYLPEMREAIQLWETHLQALLPNTESTNGPEFPRLHNQRA
jgi:integrase